MKSFLSILGLMGIPLGLYLASLLLRGGGTFWGWFGLVIFAAIDLGLFWLSTYPRRARWALGVGAGLLLTFVSLRQVRSFPTGSGALYRLPGEGAGSFLGRLADEMDLGMMSFVAFADVGATFRPDASRAKSYVRSAYRRMRQDPDFAPIPTPMLPTMLGMNSPTSFHALVFNPPPEGRAGRSIVFLHGLGGAQKLPCWLLARRMPDALIVCPSVGLRGEWAHDEARPIFETAFEYARTRSNAVYVIGHDRGAVGLLHFMNRNLLGHANGVGMIAGFNENYFDAIRRSTIPILNIRGASDERTPRYQVEGLANAHLVRNYELPGGTFVFYESEEAVLEHIDAFCGAH